MATATMIKPGKGVYLELEEEEFEIDSRILSQVLNNGDALCAHIIPVSRGHWLVGPGWLIWPTRLGPGIRSRLKKFQIDPIKLERFLQQRIVDEEKPKIEYPRDKNITEAVNRMTTAARAAGKDKLVKSVEEWKGLVIDCINSNDITSFSKKVMEWVGNISSLDDMNRWMALAMNIWNTTPQPDRGNKTADELFAEEMNQKRE